MSAIQFSNQLSQGRKPNPLKSRPQSQQKQRKSKQQHTENIYAFRSQLVLPQSAVGINTQRNSLNPVVPQHSQQTSQKPRLSNVTSAKTIRPFTQCREVQSQSEQKKQPKLSVKTIVEHQMALAKQFNSQGLFLQAFQVLNPLQLQLAVEDSRLRTYVVTFYQLFTVTCMYLAVQSKMQKPLNQAETYIAFFLRMIREFIPQTSKQAARNEQFKQGFRKLQLMTNRIKGLLELTLINSNIYGRQTDSQLVFFTHCSLKTFQEMTVTYQSQREADCFNMLQCSNEFVLLQTTLLLDLSLVMLITQNNDDFKEVTATVNKCLGALAKFEIEVLDQTATDKHLVKGDLERIKLNLICAHFLKGLILEHITVHENEKAHDFYQKCQELCQVHLTPQNQVRTVFLKMFREQSQYSVLTKLKQDLGSQKKVQHAERKLLVGLFKRKIGNDLFGNNYQPPEKEELKKLKHDVQNVFCQPKSKYSQATKSTAASGFQTQRTNASKHNENNEQHTQELDQKEKVLRQNSESSFINFRRRQTFKNIESFVQEDLQGSPERTAEVRANMSKIIKTNEAKKIELEKVFFQEKQGSQAAISNEISKSVENFFKQSIMKQLRLAKAPLSNCNDQQEKTDLAFANQETSGKEFWKRFIQNKKNFDQKIFLHENCNDFKKYFHMRLQNQNGSMERKVLATTEDIKALRFKAQQKKQDEQKSSNQATSGQVTSRSGVETTYRNWNKRSGKASVTVITPSKDIKRKGIINKYDSFKDAMQDYHSLTRIDIQEQSRQFLQSHKDYDAIGKVINYNRNNVIFREAFKDFIEDEDSLSNIQNGNSNYQTLKLNELGTKKSCQGSRQESDICKNNSRRQHSSIASQNNKAKSIISKVSPVDYWLQSQIQSEESDDHNQIVSSKNAKSHKGPSCASNPYSLGGFQNQNLKNNQVLKEQLKIDLAAMRNKIEEIEQTKNHSREARVLSREHKEKQLSSNQKDKKPFVKSSRLTESTYGLGTLDY